MSDYRFSIEEVVSQANLTLHKVSIARGDGPSVDIWEDASKRSPTVISSNDRKSVRLPRELFSRCALEKFGYTGSCLNHPEVLEISTNSVSTLDFALRFAQLVAKKIGSKYDCERELDYNGPILQTEISRQNPDSIEILCLSSLLLIEFYRESLRVKKADHHFALGVGLAYVVNEFHRFGEFEALERQNEARKLGSMRGGASTSKTSEERRKLAVELGVAKEVEWRNLSDPQTVNCFQKILQKHDEENGTRIFLHNNKLMSKSWVRDRISEARTELIRLRALKSQE